MATLTIRVPRVFKPLLQPARYKGAYGGRGSGKSHFFAELMIKECLETKGTLAVCIREVQKTLAHSSKSLIERKLQSLNVGSEFRVYNDRIATPGDGIIIFQGMADHTAESIKSLDGYRIADVEEAQTLSGRSLELLRPTIREPGSQLWFRWNPRLKSDPVDDFLRYHAPRDAVVVQANWRDNPFWNDELESERQLDMAQFPDRYEHIWEGAYATAFSGSYYSGLLTEAKVQGRICPVAPDPIISVRAYWDIGGSGASADANAIWICQFVDQRIQLLDYIETRGQTLGYIINEMRQRGWDNSKCFLPHDGVATNNITGKRYEDHLREADFDVTVIPNQGKGAAAMRIEAGRRLFNKCWFDVVKTEAGRDALAYYHEKRDPTRNVGLGPEHDWSSHCADAFGLMAISYEDPSRMAAFSRPIKYPNLGVY